MTLDKYVDAQKEWFFGKPARLWRVVFWLLVLAVVLFLIYAPLAAWFLYGGFVERA